MLFPLITAPYLSQTLGANNIGKVNFATSIVNWFILFSSFGIPRYGVREIARNRDNNDKLSISFWNLICIQCILSAIAVIVYLSIIFTVVSFKIDIKLYLVMILMIILNIFSIDWFYQGIEEYGYITVRNIIFKIISIVLIFLLINSNKDYLRYALINILGLTLNNLLNYIHAKKYIVFKFDRVKILYYFKELKIYFLTTLIIAVYTSLDQVMIGTYSQIDLAYYVRSKNVQSVGLNVTNSLLTVFIPRTAYLIEKNYKQYKEVIKKSINYIYILSIPCFIGILLLSDEIMELLGGKEFLPGARSLRIISILIVVNSIGSWQINQVLLPYKQEKVALKIQFAGAIISLLLNLLLIRKYSYIGAAYTWIITEIFIAIVSGIVIKKICKDVEIKYLNKSVKKYFISAVIMAVIIFFIKLKIYSYKIVILASLLTCPIVYFMMILLFKDEILLEIVIKMRRRFFA